ncbi:hypothetical protein NS228_16310 [Methylobacterium indicum]|uniref:hypothetical protein n=1 Tax=Methylobacterium indicum TaxID=1775910 RepID=UPI000733FFB6|nr:hypothetical protein [Methylobacterium indicum]KTS37492.1 hypothetical protein NS229_07180 [Methylobacterium indicum]KTS39073.1 hypothetical protein NS228_16310 [Methylobacterium indicum]KTS51396.1 hypothetical protein NS230_13675 [Methylobacterium indicum]
MSGAFLMVVLVCAAATAPSDCTRETATDILVARPVDLPTACALGGLMTAARGPAVAGGTYHLVRCERRKG